MYLQAAFVATAISLAGCQSTADKITDVPITTKSDDARTSTKQGLASLDAGDFQQAKIYFTKAIEQDPKLAIAYVLRTQTGETPKEYSEDIAHAKANLEGTSDWEKWYCELFNTYMNDDYNKRVEISGQIVSKYPDVARAQVDMGNTYLGGNEFVKARECFQKAVSMDPKWVGGYTALTNSYIFTEPKDFKKAEENALKVVELAPKSAGAQIALGDCYRAQLNLEKAREAYGKAMELGPGTSEPYYKKGHANTFLGNFEEARQNYIEGGKHDVSHSGSIQFTAYTYLYNGDYQAAMKYLTDESAKLDANGDSKDKISVDKINCLDNCASVAMHNGDVARLKELITMMQPLSNEVGEQAGTNEAKLLQKANIIYWESIAASMEGNFDAAKAKAEEMKSTLDPVKDPNKLSGYEFSLGYMAMKQKNYAEAVDHFGKTYLPSVYNRYWLAIANDGAGNKEKANALFKEISDFNFNTIDYALIRKEVKTKMATL